MNFVLISNSDHNEFLRDLSARVNHIKSRGDVKSEPDLKFSTTTSSVSGNVIFSALIQFETSDNDEF